jgi:hypothetical protein
MADVFVSYAREDQARVAAMVDLLDAERWSVFWDREIPPGETWRGHLGRALEQARCVVVAWSEHSVRSDWVVEEADEGKRRGILVPVLLDAVLPPWGFRGIQAADLSGWREGEGSPAVASFLAAVAKILGEGAPAPPPRPDASGSRLRGAGPGDASLGPVRVAGARWRSWPARRRLVLLGGLGGLGTVVALGAVAFLAGPGLWPGGPGVAQDPPGETPAGPPDGLPIEEASGGLPADPARTRVLDVRGEVLAVAGPAAEVGKGRVLDLRGRELAVEGPTSGLERRISPY